MSFTFKRSSKMAFLRSFLIILICCCLQQLVTTQSTEPRDAKLLQSIITERGYDARVRPLDLQGGATKITANMYIRQLSDYNSVKQEIDAQITFRQEWNDQRLRFTDSGVQYINTRNNTAIWIPDTFFSQSLKTELEMQTVPNRLLRIYPNGDVKYSLRLNIKLACPMDFRFFPFDRQQCSITFASYAQTEEEVSYKWKEANPVQFSSNPERAYLLVNFRLTEPLYTLGDGSATTATGEYATATVTLHFKRIFNPWLSMIYIPCMMCMILSAVAVHAIQASDNGFKPVHAKMIKIVMILTMMGLMALNLTISRFGAGPYTGLPALGGSTHSTAMDWYTGLSMTFVFVCLLTALLYDQERSAEQLIADEKFRRLDRAALSCLMCRYGLYIILALFVVLYFFFVLIIC